MVDGILGGFSVLGPPLNGGDGIHFTTLQD